MNLYTASHDYMNKVLGTPGMKALLLDQETTQMIGNVYSQSDIIAKQVFLVERVDNRNDDVYRDDDGKQNMHHLSAVCFVRPTKKTINCLKAALRAPRFKEYHFFFSNIVPTDQLEQLAKADQHDLVRQVQEIYCDFHMVDETLFSTELYNTRCLNAPADQWGREEDRLFERSLQSVLASLLAVKKRPIIRYERESQIAKKMAISVMQRMKEEGDLFHTQGQAVLLVLDRRDDPVTPLLQQWTYQAMVHELVGIENNRVDLSKVPDIRKELREVVLNPQEDEFYKKSMYLNFGELGKSVKQLVADYQVKTKDTTKVDTIEEMQRFVDNYPEFRQMAGNVSKHVSMMQELSRLVSTRKLMDVSELEQDLACTHDHSAALEGVTSILENSSIGFNEKLRVTMLYALRYERERNSLSNIIALLRDKADTDAEREKIRAVDEVLQYGGADKRGGDLFGNKSIFKKATRFLGTGLKGVENIYTQHKPLLQSVLDGLSRGKLKPANYPFLDTAAGTQHYKSVPKSVVIYVVGGVTYEEQACVAAFNQANAPDGMRVILGGTCVHNSKTFIDNLLLRKRRT